MNNKGFTLVEMLAVVAILAILTMIMVPTVNTLITKNSEENYKKFKDGVISAARIYLSDNRYEVSIEGSCEENQEKNISLSVGETQIIKWEDSRLLINTLVDAGNIKTNSDGKIINPKDKSKELDINNSYVIVKYSCKKKDFTYELKDNYLYWNSI